MPETPMNQNAGDPTAVATLNERLADTDFVDRFNAGDPTARAEMHHLHQHAYPGTQADESHGSSAAHVAHEETPPDDPRGYKFQYGPGRHIEPHDDRALRELAHAAGLPQSLARQLHGLFIRDVNAPQPDDVTVQLNAKSTEAKLRQRWGDQYDQKIAAARAVFKGLPAQHTKTVERIIGRGNLGSDQFLIERLASHAERRRLK